MDEIVQLRAEEASLLGFANFGELSLATKMAESPHQVVTFMRELALRARPLPKMTWQNCANLRAPSSGWRIAVVGCELCQRKLREKRYAFSRAGSKTVFPRRRGAARMFRLVETLYVCRSRHPAAPVWHDDVRFFDIRDAKSKLVGQFYLDMYARNSKRGGRGWTTRSRAAACQTAFSTPVAYLNCNFSAPVGGNRRSSLTTK